MKRSKKNKVLIVFLVMAIVMVIIAGYIYKEYNRRPADTSTLKPDIFIEANLLISEFSNGDSIANKKYLGKLIEVTGYVKNIDSSTQKEATIKNYTMVLGDTAQLSSVRCNMKANAFHTPTSLLHSTIKIKGICTGYLPDEMGLGADVILENAIITQTFTR